ncbi:MULTISPECIES: Hcp family type VI secretion system effector [Pseudomonas]|uniref:Hcp family type VI secretion system effector n=1 Tax=Pseudomonas TaxID=286 RepID=UPI000B362A57|nr:MULTISPECIES: Hcp family type VI secretion system effector [Pseudomonas]PMY34142.1 type VI secretion system tube protein Hcp [Pseudomonas sp. GW456-L14]PMY52978.1 type VI secretion system tube protein Hcp [Pseudomonas sp. GW456-L12]PMY65485.1 type VI secretion system tube protein Hcp [Pseudomonas sp. FW305-25]PMY72589.1 type VI secretion system tube protein Hcp [Pseudomonas sp. FW126-L8]PNA71251.1 type VI secretion system tube protein Hcp [Pseudomonas sp. FW305-76]
MASHSYMSISGKRQGLISFGCSGPSSIGNKCQIGHQDEIMVLAYTHDMMTGNDGSVAGGRGQHMPIVITKGIDKASPLLASALHEREEVECTINLYRTTPTGGQEKYYSIHLAGARIAHISQQVPHAIHMNDAEPQERVSIRYRDITWVHIPGGTSAQSTWGSERE